VFYNDDCESGFILDDDQQQFGWKIVAMIWRKYLLLFSGCRRDWFIVQKWT
jgi:hypothetical protein